MEMVSVHLKRSLRTFSTRSLNNLIRRPFASVASEEKIIKSPAPFLHLPKGNFVNLLFQDVNKWETETALECAETGKTVSFAELVEQTERWSGFLRQMGVSKGDVVGIISPNCLQYGPIIIGTASVGAALSPMNWRYTSEEIRRMVGITQPKLLIFSHETAENVRQALVAHTGEMTLLCIEKTGHQNGKLAVDEILDGSKSTQTCSPEKLTGEEIIYVPLSSGTTGHPKAVALSHNAWIANILQFKNPYHDMFLDRRDVTLGMLPFFHIYGMFTILMLGLQRGNKIVVMRSFSPKLFLDAIIKHKVSFLYLVPSILNFMVNSPQCNPQMMASVSSIFCGAAPLHESITMSLMQRMKKDVMFFEGYGMTENSVLIFTPRRFPRLGTCGQLMSNNEAKVIDPDTGKYLGPKENGEICIRGPGAMKEYMNKPAETRTILKDGWIHTGDIGHYDNDGFWFIVDRTKDMIKVHGMQVSPSEVEDELLKHPSVAECSIIGVPDERTGEAPRAFVVLKEKTTVEDLHQFLKVKLSKHKQLRGGITFVESLPKSETGKVLRRVLRTIT